MIDENTLRQFVKIRKPYHHDRLPFIVFWSHKSGCTAIFKWFLFHAGLLDEANGYIPNNKGSVRSIHKYENQIFKSRPNYTPELITKLRTGSPIVCFVRCPFERTFSSYMHLNNPIFLTNPKWPSPEGQARREVIEAAYGQGRPITHPISFWDFLEWLKNRDLEAVDIHLRPQYGPLFDSFQIAFYRLEELSLVIPHLENYYSMRSSRDVLDEILASSHHMDKGFASKSETLDLLSEGVELRTKGPRFVPRVSREMLEGTRFGEVITQIYGLDIELFDRISKTSH